ncbi:helix-turn-helix domain-containing protein [Actinocorallia sp. A-T 12471]|uniref:TetR/AcrR family transcriptional regulator n=1 Tax=Actinocorallia sp. A-T 12471 TaxID=3089813 RepID=UPI0029D0B949|nr:helix-turn-helix domain-containing protein [Actinocorallia sp. A-T 12471]MDX6741118.1 helix-turn-helix domain-containing protein [Actinocorallia sp. A-T 12471]
MANLRAAQKEMTRRRLLAKALELFDAKGYAATTVEDIAVAAGTTKVTFYAHFASRSDLMRALIGQLNEILRRAGSADGYSSRSAELVAAVREGSRDGLAHWLRDSAARWPEIRPYLTSALDAAVIDPDLRGLVDEWFEEAIADIATGLDQAGRFDPETRRVRAVLAFNQLDALARRWMRRGWDVDEDRALDVLISSWTHLLAEE